MPVVKPDRFQPILLSSPPLEVSGEQLMYIDEILRTACSDSRFAQKALVAITYVLTHGIDKVPEVSSVSPNTAVAGTVGVAVTVMGKEFSPTSKVVVAGVEKPTTFNSVSELAISLDVPFTAGDLPVAVLSDNGYLSNSVPFSVTAAKSESTESTKQAGEYHEKRLEGKK